MLLHLCNALISARLHIYVKRWQNVIRVLAKRPSPRDCWIAQFYNMPATFSAHSMKIAPNDDKQLKNRAIYLQKKFFLNRKNGAIQNF